MADPVLHVLAGPNGAGKSTLYTEVLWPSTRLHLVNADVIAADRWPHDPSGHAYEGAKVAAQQRHQLIGQRRSFVTETVFSHESKVELVEYARSVGYVVTLHVVCVPVELAVARVTNRVEYGGHDVPEDKVRSRHHRLWSHVAAAINVADHTLVYDNTRAARPLRLLASYTFGRQVGTPDWPSWTPDDLRHAGR